MYTNFAIGAIIIVSSFLVLECIIEYSIIMKSFRELHSEKSNFMKLGPFIVMMMIWLFFMSYITIGVSIGLNIKVNFNGLLASIFFVGAIFTYLVIRLQKRMLEYLDNSNIEAISALVNAIEARDEYTKGHSQHVANLVEVYYQELDKKDQDKFDIKKLKVAGLLHDIGKIGIKERILNKPEKLDENEYKAISRHPQIGNEILANVTHLKEIANWIYYHHERVDGKGYFGKKGDEIPLESRLLTVLDTYSALVTDRVYRKGMSHLEAMEIMKKLEGTQLDVDLLKKFTKVPENKLEECKVNVS